MQHIGPFRKFLFDEESEGSSNFQLPGLRKVGERGVAGAASQRSTNGAEISDLWQKIEADPTILETAPKRQGRQAESVEVGAGWGGRKDAGEYRDRPPMAIG